MPKLSQRIVAFVAAGLILLSRGYYGNVLQTPSGHNTLDELIDEP